MQPTEAVLVLLLVVALLTLVARRIGVPYPILMTIGGLALGLVPGLPHVTLAPDLVFLLFLPPLLFAAGFFTSPRELLINARPIGLLAIGLVLTTTAGVAVVVHAMAPALGWPASFALGAIVSPTDAIAATAIARRLGIPRRLITILEGESLVNDATGLVTLRLALAAAVTGAFSIGPAIATFVFVSLGGVVIGFVIGWALVQLETHLDDPPVEVLLSLLAPFAAWVPAEAIHVSGVLSVVTSAIVFGRHSPRITSSNMRILASGVWQMVIFVLNGLVFILMGLQLPTILEVLAANRSLGQLLALAAAVCFTVVAVRMLWVFPGTYLPRWLIPGLARRDPAPSPRVVVVLGWAGMRGVVSLAAALSLKPAEIGEPARDLIIFLTFAVIVVTLVGQGLTLPAVIRAMRIGDDGSAAHEELHARDEANQAALARLEELREEWPGHLPLIDNIKERHEHALEHLEHEHEDFPAEQAPDQEAIEHAAIRRAVIDAQRFAILDLRDRGVISDEALRIVERELDLEELRAEA